MLFYEPEKYFGMRKVILEKPIESVNVGTPLYNGI